MQEKNIKFFIAIPVWGRSYVDLFLNISLATLMTKDNLPYLCKISSVMISIYTTPDFTNEIQQNYLIQKLSEIADVVIECIYAPNKDHYSNENQLHDYNQHLYETKSNAYKDNIYKAKLSKFSTKIILSLNADMAFANDFMRHCYEHILSGKKVVEIIGPRGNADAIKNELLTSFFDTTNQTISISSHKLLRLWIDHRHPLLDIHLWNGNSDYFNCSHIMWPIPNHKGWIARCFFLYPIYTKNYKNLFACCYVFIKNYM